MAPPADERAEGRDPRASALVIDDETPALDELSYLLRTDFPIAPVHAAQNASDALRHLQERRYDVVFLDVRMPELNGIELGNVLRRFAAPPAIVYVTAYEEYAVRAFDIGACDYLLKPVSRARLRTALERALGPRSADRPHGPAARRRFVRPDPGRDGRADQVHLPRAGALGRSRGRLRAAAHRGRRRPPGADPDLAPGRTVVGLRLHPHPPRLPRVVQAHHRVLRDR